MGTKNPFLSSVINQSVMSSSDNAGQCGCVTLPWWTAQGGGPWPYVCPVGQAQVPHQSQSYAVMLTKS